MDIMSKHSVRIKTEEKKTTFVFTNNYGLHKVIPKKVASEFKEYLLKNTIANIIFPYWEDNKEYEFTITITQL